MKKKKLNEKEKKNKRTKILDRIKVLKLRVKWKLKITNKQTYIGDCVFYTWKSEVFIEIWKNVKS